MSIILLDLDGVVRDFVGYVKAKLEHYGFDVPAIAELDLAASLDTEQADAIDDLMCERGSCFAIPPLPGAAWFVAELQRHGEVFAVTSPLTRSRTWQKETVEWCRAHLRLDPDHVLSVKSNSKYLVRGDWMIEDSPQTLRWWCGFEGQRGILIAHESNVVDRAQGPWNFQIVSQLADAAAIIRGAK